MKEHVLYRSMRIAVPAVALMVLGYACSKVPAPVPAPDVAVNPDLEMTPPIASAVRIKEVKGDPEGNLLVEADFGRGQIKGQFHAVQLSTGKVVLRDDGNGGDSLANDGRFTTLMTEDIAGLTSDLEEASKMAMESSAKPRAFFIGRELQRASAPTAKRIDLDSFRRGDFFPLPPGFWCKFLLDVSVDHSLMITAVSVVEDPSRTSLRPCDGGASATKPWTFGKLMTDMANTPGTGVTPEDFVRNWLSTWLNTVTVNGDQVPQRTQMFDLVIKPWVLRSSTPPPAGVTINNWMTKPLDLKQAPFKLTAIVNRLDLRGNSGYGFANPGEGRFIFEVLDPNTCVPFSPMFNVIFEYGLPIKSCAALKAYAQQWYDLKSLPLTDPSYSKALQDLTDVFAKANAAPSKPNGSAINQIRTNERAVGQPWELREFNLDPGTHQLFVTTVKQEPAEKYNAKGMAPDPTMFQSLADWINTNEAAVIADKHKVPDLLSPGQHFLGGKARTDGGVFWDAAPMAILNDKARHHFSLNACTGCHDAETKTAFVHVDRAVFGSQAPLSGFLTGISVTDPAGRPPSPPRVFSDLERRRVSLEDLLCTACQKPIFELAAALTFKPLNMTH